MTELVHPGDAKDKLPHPATYTFHRLPDHQLLTPLFRLDTNDALEFLCPILGPSAIVVLNRLAAWADDFHHNQGTDTFATPAADLGGHFGLSEAMLAKTIHRLAEFSMLERRNCNLGIYALSTSFYHYPQRWMVRLPQPVRLALTAWIDTCQRR